MIKSIEIGFRKFILQLFLFLSSSHSRQEESEINSNSSVLLIRLNRIGDALVTTPFIALLKKNIGCKIVVLADRKNSFIFENNPNIDSVEVFNKGIKGFFIAKKLSKKYKFDVLVNLHDDVSTTVSFITALSGIKNRYSLYLDNHKLFTKTISRIDSEKNHVIDRNLELLKLFGITNHDNQNIEYHLMEKTQLFLEDYIKKNKLSDKFLVGINISAGSLDRFWGIDNYINIIKIFTRYDVNLLIITSNRDIELAKQINKDFSINIFCSESFDEFAGIVSKLDFLFTPDTSIVHLASVWEIPSFILFVQFNTKDIIWYPYKSEYETIITQNPNLKNIKFTEVKNKLLPFFEKVLNERNTKL